MNGENRRVLRSVGDTGKGIQKQKESWNFLCLRQAGQPGDFAEKGITSRGDSKCVRGRYCLGPD